MLDDIIIYRRGETNFMVVVNASNEPKIKFYLHELMEGRVAVETEQSAWAASCRAAVDVWDMRDPNRAKDRRVDIALQGPASMDTSRETDG